MRLVLALVFAGLLLGPVNWLVRGVWAAWGTAEAAEPTFTDACLVIILVLLCIALFKPGPRTRPPE